MTKTQNGSPDGVALRSYKKDKEYNLPEDLANVFINDIKCAKKVVEIVETPEDGLDEIVETPENWLDELEIPEKKTKK